MIEVTWDIICETCCLWHFFDCCFTRLLTNGHILLKKNLIFLHTNTTYLSHFYILFFFFLPTFYRIQFSLNKKWSKTPTSLHQTQTHNQTQSIISYLLVRKTILTYYPFKDHHKSHTNELVSIPLHFESNFLPNPTFNKLFLGKTQIYKKTFSYFLFDAKNNHTTIGRKDRNVSER